MKKNAQLEYCKVCNHQKFDPNQGIICKLTDAPASFESTCDSYDQNDFLVQKEEEIKASNTLNSRAASKGKRLANYFIDYIILIIINFNIGMVIGVIIGMFYPEYFDYIDSIGLLEQYIFGTIVGTVYYTLFESITGRSIGKLITKTKVVNEEGGKPTFHALLIRSLCRFIPFEAFSFLGAETKGWHDTISNTRVIETN